MPPEIGPLPDALAEEIFQVLKGDDKFALGPILWTGDVSPAQISMYAANLAFSNTWHRYLQVETRDRICLLCDLAFTPAEAEGPDPLAESAHGVHDVFDPWRRHSELHAGEHVTVLHGAGPEVVVSYSDGPEGGMSAGIARSDAGQDVTVSYLENSYLENSGEGSAA